MLFGKEGRLVWKAHLQHVSFMMVSYLFWPGSIDYLIVEVSRNTILSVPPSSVLPIPGTLIGYSVVLIIGISNLCTNFAEKSSVSWCFYFLENTTDLAYSRLPSGSWTTNIWLYHPRSILLVSPHVRYALNSSKTCTKCVPNPCHPTCPQPSPPWKSSRWNTYTCDPKQGFWTCLCNWPFSGKYWCSSPNWWRWWFGSRRCSNSKIWERDYWSSAWFCWECLHVKDVGVVVFINLFQFGYVKVQLQKFLSLLWILRGTHSLPYTHTDSTCIRISGALWWSRQGSYYWFTVLFCTESDWSLS